MSKPDLVVEARELVRNKSAPLYVIPNPNWKNAYVRLSHNADAEWTSFGYVATVTNEYAQLFARAPELLGQFCGQLEQLRGFVSSAASVGCLRSRRVHCAENEPNSADWCISCQAKYLIGGSYEKEQRIESV